MYGDIFEDKSPIINLLKSITDIAGLSVCHIFGLKPYDDSYDNYYSNINMINKIYPIFSAKQITVLITTTIKQQTAPFCHILLLPTTALLRFHMTKEVL